MSKILKNTTGLAIQIKEMGLSIPASGQIELATTEFPLLASIDTVAELTTLITSGDIVINDGVDDLSVSDGINFIKYPDTAFNIRFLSEPDRSNEFTAKTVQEAIEDSRVSGIGTVQDFHFSSGGSNTSNAWLFFGDPSAPSNEVPMIAPQKMEIKGVTISNKDDNSDTDVEIHINGILATTVEFRNFRFAWQVGGTLATLNQSDRLSVFIKKVGAVSDAPSKPNVSIYCKFVSEGPLTGSQSVGD